MRFVCKICGKIRSGGEPITCGHKASDYNIADDGNNSLNKTEEKIIGGFTDKDLEGIEDPEGFKRLFGEPN
jgi:hypothetical protein